jgi:hypothetical protein
VLSYGLGFRFGANTDFALCGVDESCITPPFDGCRGDQGYVNAGSMFYAYNNPYGCKSHLVALSHTNRTIPRLPCSKVLFY